MHTLGRIEFEHRLYRDGYIMKEGKRVRLTGSGMFSVFKDGVTDLYSDLTDAWRAFNA
jgi:hypothetical protein